MVCDSSGVPTYVTLSGDATISNTGVITVSSNGVALGTDTTGDYVQSLVAGTGVTLSNNSGESATPTVAIGQSVATTASPTFANLSLSGTASVASNLTVSGSAAITGATTVGGSITATGNVVYHITTASIASGGSLATTNDGQLIELTGNNATLTVPNTSWTTGTQITIMQMGTGSASITFTSATDIKATPRAAANIVVLRTQYSTATLIHKGATNDWYVVGDLKA